MKATITTEEIKTIETTKGILKYYRDFDNDGFIVMLNAKTINRYNEIKDQHPDAEKYGVLVFQQRAVSAWVQELSQ